MPTNPNERALLAICCTWLACAVPQANAAGATAASGLDERATLSLRQPAEDAASADELAGLAPVETFGAAGTEHWSILSGVGFALENDDDSTDANLAIAYSRFLADDIEMVLELGAWGFFQDGDDAAGISPNLVFRWHFVNRQAWTLYGDLGIGLLFATDDVPDTGTSFNFMPRVGVGGTYRIADDGTRLIGGIRWHHVSNARINGDDNNPDRDGVMLYAGIQFPF